MSSIVDSLKRLERAGSERSRATEKLREAAAAVALEIIRHVPPGVELPGWYVVRRLTSNVGSEFFLVLPGFHEPGSWENGGPESADAYIDGTGGYLHGDFSCSIPAPSRAALLRFAADIAGGLLGEIADFIEKRNAEDARATECLEDASALPTA